MVYLLLLLIFLTTVLLLKQGHDLLYAGRTQARERLTEQTVIFEEAGFTYEESEPHLSFKQRLNQFFVSTSLYGRFQRLIARSYIRITPEELLKFSLIGGAGFALLGWLLGRGSLAAMLLFGIGVFLPPYSLRLIGMQRVKQLSKQLPQALSILSNGLRAGFSFMQAMSIVSREMEAPIADEFGRILKESQLGKPMDEALQDFEERANDEDASFLVSTLLIQMQVGGDLAEILDIIAHTIRERTKLKGQINTLTSQSKFSALIIGVLPVAIAVILFMMNPEYMGLLFSEPLGLMMVGAAAVMMVTGIFALYKIVNIKM